MATDIPTTVWQATNGNYEFDNTGANNIVDPAGNFLVDPSAVFIVDTGVTATLIPTTVWTEEDNV